MTRGLRWMLAEVADRRQRRGIGRIESPAKASPPPGGVTDSPVRLHRRTPDRTEVRDTGDPPGPRFLAWLHWAAVYQDPLRTLTWAVREYGDVVHLRMGKKHHFLLNHPDYIRAILLDHDGMRRSIQVPLRRFLGNGLLSSSGTFHQRQRRILQPAFHKERMAAFGEIMAQESALCSDRWKDGATVDMAEEMLRLSMAIVSQALFSADFEAEAGDLGEAVKTALATTRLKYSLIDSLGRKVPLLRNRSLERARERLDRLLYDMIAERRADGKDRGDLLSMLVRMGDSEDETKVMTDEQIRDEILTLFTAGHETIANALMWTWYLLAEHPGATEKLHAELDCVLGGRLPAVSDLEHLPYTRRVLTESMRLYPPVWIMGRRAVRDTEVGGYVIPKGAHVHVSQFLMHRDARYFPDPERFDPDRWEPEAASARPRFSYFPFGGGSLQCIGEGFAWTEGLLVIATLAGRWRMRTATGHRIRLDPQITLRARYGMSMTLEKRK